MIPIEIMKNHWKFINFQSNQYLGNHGPPGRPATLMVAEIFAAVFEWPVLVAFGFCEYLGGYEHLPFVDTKRVTYGVRHVTKVKVGYIHRLS